VRLREGPGPFRVDASRGADDAVPMSPALPLLLALAATAPSSAAADAGGDVKAADLAMSRAVEARDAAAFAAFLDPDAIFASARGLSGGRDVVVATWRPYLTEGGPTLTWHPERALVSTSGDLAVTTGRFTWTGTSDGKPARAEGEYVTVWGRSDDGRWRVIFDASLEPAAKLGPGLERTPVRFAAAAAHDLEATLGTWKRGSEGGAYLTVRHGAETAVESAFRFRRPR
jgi:ketosteroid isomerase-like protein